MNNFWHQVKYLWNIYKIYLKNSLALSMSFRLHFILLIFLDLFFYFTTFMGLNFIFDSVGQIGSWNRDQFLFFLSFMLMLDVLHMTFVAESFWHLPLNIRTGQIDFVLLKPAPSLLQVFGQNIRPASFFNILITLPLLIYYAVKVELPWWGYLSLPFLILMGISIWILLDILVSTLMFWMLEGTGINFLRIEFQKLARYPDFIYPKFLRLILMWGLPLLLIGMGPVNFLLFPQTGLWYLFGLVGMMIILMTLVQWFWKKAIDRYESASS
jgi:ABC-2 type transport system permease protein